MASIRIKTNIDVVTTRIRERLDKLKDKDYLIRPVAFDVIDLMTKRIHIDGKAADESQIGTYSNGYMALRTGKFANADKFSKGKNKGKNKNAGIVTKKKVQLFGTTENVFADITPMGKARISYNRSDDTKIIVSLTRQLENDWSVIATDKGYGIGFLNLFNTQKARWVEENKSKKIFFLSGAEKDHALKRLQELVRQALNDK